MIAEMKPEVILEKDSCQDRHGVRENDMKRPQCRVEWNRVEVSRRSQTKREVFKQKLWSLQRAAPLQRLSDRLSSKLIDEQSKKLSERYTGGWR